MLCSSCNKEFNNPSHVCPYCAAFVRMQSAKPLDFAPAKEANFPVRPSSEKPSAVETEGKTHKKHRHKRWEDKPKNIDKLTKRFHINWAWMSILGIILVFATVAGIYIFLNFTLQGQVILVRQGKEGSAEAQWIVGDEEFKKGDLLGALSLYQKASESYEIGTDNLKRLLNYAEVLEAAQNQERALEVYKMIYTDGLKITTETRYLSENLPLARELSISAYKNSVRLLRNANRLAEASDLLKEAYDATQDSSFSKERSSFVPMPPTASLTAGSHLFSKDVSFISEEGYDIYYTLGSEPLPEGGTLFTEPIRLDEGVYEFRAVCVSDLLVSDEMVIKYFISLPVPLAPKSNLAPGTYSKSLIVKLRNIDEDKNITMYYTVDGSQPTVDSPVYTDEGIRLPPGRVWLRAIAENRYGKISNELVVEYKIGGKFKSYYGKEDVFPKFALMQTPRDRFVAQHGDPISSDTGVDTLIKGGVTILKYPWGEARFTATERGELLYYISTDNASMGGPRGTKVGQSMKDIMPLYKDMMQPYNTNGSRGLYHEDNSAKGYFKSSDGSQVNGKLIYFRVYSEEGLSGVLYLYYDIENGKVTRITNYFTPDKITLLEHR